MRHWQLVALLAPVALAAGGEVRADEAPPAPPVEPDEIVVRVRPAAAEAARAPGAAVTTVDADRFAGEAKSTAALLATSPGVTVSERGPGQLALVSIRGSSAAQVKVLVDGLQLNGAAGGGVDLSTIPAPWISRIEVVRGTEGVHHGSGALGGVVNVVTLPVKAGTWGTSATAGSFGTYEGDVHLAEGGERWGLLASLTGSTTDGRFPYENTFLHRPEVRGHAAAAQGGGLLKAFWLAGGGRVDAAVQASGGRRDLPGAIQNPTPSDWQEDARGLFAAKYRVPLGGGPTLTAGSWVRLDRLTVSLQELGGGEPTRQRGVAGAGSLALAWQGEGWAASASGEAGSERISADGIGDRARPTFAAAFAGEVSLLRGRVRLGPGLRLERAGPFQGVSAKLGASALLAGPVSIRASAGRSFRVPSFGELYLQQGVVAPNPDLRPEIGLGGDAALVVDGRVGSLSLGGFAVVYDDLVVYEAASFRRFMPRNDARSSTRGLEGEGASAPLRGFGQLSVAVAYTYLVTETLRGTTAVLGKELPQLPRHRLLARATGGGGPISLHVDAQWISQRWVDLANTAAVPGAFTLDAGAAVRLARAPDLRLSVEVRNALDLRTAQDGFMNPLPGRAILVTVRTGSAEEDRR
jgi:iron complex outermembrane receptor protein